MVGKQSGSDTCSHLFTSTNSDPIRTTSTIRESTTLLQGGASFMNISPLQALGSYPRRILVAPKTKYGKLTYPSLLYILLPLRMSMLAAFRRTSLSTYSYWGRSKFTRMGPGYRKVIHGSISWETAGLTFISILEDWEGKTHLYTPAG